MSFIERDLIAALLANGSLAGQVSTRIWPLVAPDEAAHPYVVIERIAGDVGYHADGPAGHVVAVVRCSCVGRRYADAKGVANALVTAVSGYRGSWANSLIYGIFVSDEVDEYAEDTGQFVVNIYLTIHFKEQ
jgi:hypothetical protein